MQKIIPHLWFDGAAKGAADFYCSLFPNLKVKNLTMLHNTPSGDADIVSFELSGQSFMAISAGPLFKFNPSVSFFVNFDPSKDGNAGENLKRKAEESRRNRLLLGEAFGNSGSRAMRLAQGQVWPVLADCSCCDEGDDGKRIS